MPVVSNWSCTGTLVGTLLNETCGVTGYANATTSPATNTPLYIQDSGDISFGLAWIVFFLAMIFLGMIWNVVPIKRI